MPKRPDFMFDPDKLDLSANNQLSSAAHAEAVSSFLLAIHRLTPSVADDLRTVSVLYTPLVGRALWGWFPHDKWWYQLAEVDDDECRQFREGIQQWAVRYHLDENSTGTVLYLHIAIHAVDLYVQRVMAHSDLPLEFYSSGSVVPSEVRGFTEGKLRLALQKELSKSPLQLSLLDGLDFVPVLSRKFFETQFPFSFQPTFQEVRKQIPTSNRRMLDFEEVIASMFTPRAPINQPRSAAFDPQRDSWDEFEKAIDELFKQYKTAYKNGIYEWEKKTSYSREQLKLKKEHFEWFVLYQVGNMTFEDISQYLMDQDPTGDLDGSPEPDTIRKQIPSIANLTGISLRI